MLTQTPAGSGHAKFPFRLSPEAPREAAEGLYFRHTEGSQRFVVLLLGGMLDQQDLAAVVTLDEHLLDRFEVLARFHRSRRDSPGQPDRRVTRLRRRNLRQMLQAVDGRLSDATYPQVAEALFGTRRVAAISWKSLSLRDTTLRRVRDGLRIVNGGYRRLLHHRRPV